MSLVKSRISLTSKMFVYLLSLLVILLSDGTSEVYATYPKVKVTKAVQLVTLFTKHQFLIHPLPCDP